ncbi:uncharacterized protein RJT20DRAFT_145498 [Scheffersomyces xylosifermentans]|uniref:uncharacterized protein n=1 Tax=Scheffersomyces xylosifermentans TaxID=1304137 RepID=UPI00315C9F6F
MNNQLRQNHVNRVKQQFQSSSVASLESIPQNISTLTNTSTNNRKAAQATRTLKACDLCRKQKTRCFRSPENKSCLRCTFLNKPCSFEFSVEAMPMTPSASSLTTIINDQAETNRKLDLIYNGIHEVISMMKNTGSTGMTSNSSTNNSLAVCQFYSTSSSIGKSECFQSPTATSKMSPFSVINNQVKATYIPRPLLNLMNLSTVSGGVRQNNYFDSSEDLLSLEILSESEAIDLMNDFRQNYGRWVSFPKTLSTEVLIERIRNKSSLLLTTCCCLSLRYSLNGINPGDAANFNRKKKTYKDLIKQLIRDMDKALIRYGAFHGATDGSGEIEFLQAMVILSIYSFSLSSIVPTTIDNDSLLEDELDECLKDFNLDPWFLSSIGLTTFITKSTFGTLFKSVAVNKDASPRTLMTANNAPFTVLYDELDSDEHQTLTVLRIYNHMCLVHLIQCVFSGRMCVVDEIRLNYCTSTLSLPSATNFDGRMVSEIGILLIAYNYIQVNSSVAGAETMKECESSFLAVKEEIRLWYEQWEYLFTQPGLQFVELNYNFCNLIAHYSYVYQKSQIIKPSRKEESPNNGSSSRIATSQLYDENNIQFILQNSDKITLLKMIQYSYNVVRFINVIESDSYFAYLSDQLHFCFYFCGICLINIVKYLLDTDQLKLLEEPDVSDISASSEDYSVIIKDIRNLIQKFSRVGQDNQDDIITKYKIGLENYLYENLP